MSVNVDCQCLLPVIATTLIIAMIHYPHSVDSPLLSDLISDPLLFSFSPFLSFPDRSCEAERLANTKAMTQTGQSRSESTHTYCHDVCVWENMLPVVHDSLSPPFQHLHPLILEFSMKKLNNFLKPKHRKKRVFEFTFIDITVITRC